MKTDLFTSVAIAIVGVILAFFVTNLLINEADKINDVTVPTIDTSKLAAPVENYNFATIDEPDNEIFNYDALNPTVEAYVGDNPDRNPTPEPEPEPNPEPEDTP